MLLECVDTHFFKLSKKLEVIGEFLENVSEAVKEIQAETRKNWRQAVFFGKAHMLVQDQQVFKHHLRFYASDYGGIPDYVVSMITDHLLKLVENKINYVFDVLLPTVLVWFVVAFTPLTYPQARLYLRFGGASLNQGMCFFWYSVLLNKF